ncbi:F0F1 ATP synthase subunit B [Flavobacterium sp.]|uniref:F0F1 ATP synthase subunit B n=1 Tax=Flavobacterium sp. TaxID=239 RepID=UPI0028BDC90E|nr:F0F1 ATP synthase subunit B [Flavobacterium sp.]
MNLTSPESLIFWTSIIFLVFFFLMKKFAWKPILGAVKSREESINNALAAAETAKKEMMNLKADNQRLLDEARAERDTMMKEAREIKEKMIADAKSEAETQGAKMIAQAQATIEGEKNAALAELKTQVSGLSLEIAEKLLKGELSNKESQTTLVEKMLDEVKLN